MFSRQLISIPVLFSLALHFSASASAVTVSLEDQLYFSSKGSVGGRAEPVMIVMTADDQALRSKLPDGENFIDTVMEILDALSDREAARCEVELETENGYIRSFRVNYPNPDQGSFLEIGLDDAGVHLVFDNSRGDLKRISHDTEPRNYKSVMQAFVNLISRQLISDKYGLVFLPAGSYVDESGNRFTLEPFAIGEHAVTRRLWFKVADWAEVNGYSPFASNPKTGDRKSPESKADERAMTSVTWHETLRWCNAYSEMNGLDPVYLEKPAGAVYRTGERVDIKVESQADGFRLPTEQEWEYACRAGTTTRFFWGDGNAADTAGKYAWWIGNSKAVQPAVASKMPNAFGLYDMHGGVWEWCFTSDVGPYKVTRGGSYRHWLGESASSANHYPHAGKSREIYLGFRLTRTVSTD